MASIVHDEWPSTSKGASCIPPTNGYISTTSNIRHIRPPTINPHPQHQQPYHHNMKQPTYIPSFPPVPYYNVTWPAPAHVHPNYVNNLANGLVSVYITPPPFPPGCELHHHGNQHFVSPPPPYFGYPTTPLHLPPPAILPHVPPPNPHKNHQTRQLAGLPPPQEDNVWNNAVSAWEQRTLINNKIGLTINHRYEIVQSIDSGSYGAIFVAEDLQNNRNRVAVKFDCASKDDHLKYEYEVYKSALYEDGIEKVEGFPKVYWFGQEYGHNILAMELLGPPIASLFNFCERKFGWQTILSLGEQMIRRVKHLHQRGFIHRDIKPENFLMGLNENETACYLIDFGLARRYRYRDDNRQLKHIPFRRGRSFVGTAKYASLNSHKSAELSRRDDIESLGYVLIELINGSLPWKKLKVRNAYTTKHQMYIKIKNEKEKANWSEICPSMAAWIDYSRKLEFDVEPDYDLLLSYLRNIHLNKPEPPLVNGISATNLNASRCTLCQQSMPKKAMKKGPKDSSSDIENLLDISSIKTAPEPVEHSAAKNLEIVEIPGRKLSKSESVRLVSLSEENCVVNYENDVGTKNKSLSDHKNPPFIVPVTEQPLIQEMSSSSTQEESFGAEGKSTESTKFEEDSASTASSCKKCRERRQQYFDQKSAMSGKYSWQVWRESTLERKFQYDNRFSWTLPLSDRESILRAQAQNTNPEQLPRQFPISDNQFQHGIPNRQ